MRKKLFGEYTNEIRYFYIYDKKDNLPIYIESIGKTIANKNYCVQRERSDLIVLEYVLSGSGYIEIQNNKYKVKQGDVYIIEPRTKHIYYSDKENPFTKIWINFYSDLFDEIIKKYKLSNKVVFDGKNTINYFNQLFVLGDNVHQNKDIYLTVSNIIMSILLQLVKNMEHTNNDNKSLEKAKNIIDSNILNEIDLDKIANDLGFSKSHFIREFKKSYGVSPYSYFLDQKIKYAKVLLEVSHYSLEEIGENLKFSDQFYFSRIFKKKTGISPGKYRKNFARN